MRAGWQYWLMMSVLSFIASQLADLNDRPVSALVVSVLGVLAGGLAAVLALIELRRATR
jgi:hypothetical protein